MPSFLPKNTLKPEDPQNFSSVHVDFFQVSGHKRSGAGFRRHGAARTMRQSGLSGNKE
jgi:hypothetical protein